MPIKRLIKNIRSLPKIREARQKAREAKKTLRTTLVNEAQQTFKNKWGFRYNPKRGEKTSSYNRIRRDLFKRYLK